MSSTPTILDVARESGYSKSTVSLVLRGSSEIPASTHEAILKTIKQLGYRHNRFASSLRSGRSNVIGMLIQDHLNPFYAELVYHVEKLLRAEGYDLIVSSSNTDLKIEMQTIERMISHQVDGIILSAIQYKKIAKLLQTSKQMGIHCVLAGLSEENIPYDSATIELGEATRQMIEHLFELGHRKFGFVWGAPSFQGIGSRYEMFCKALKKHKLSMNDDWIVHCGVTLQDGYDAGRKLLDAKNRPSAVFVLNDLLAIGVMRAATDLKLKVPQDVSIVGVDNIEFSTYLNPSLSTISQPIAQYADALTTLVLKGIRNKGVHRPQCLTLQAEPLFRESTGAAPAA